MTWSCLPEPRGWWSSRTAREAAAIARGTGAPLIVGGHDTEVLDLNRWALSQLRCEKRLAVVPGATHLFEEPGALQVVADLAAEWFAHHLGAKR